MKEKFTGGYVNHMDSLPRTRFRYLLPQLDLASNASLVDFGCGSGSLLDVVGDKVQQYTGVDFSSDFIRYAARRARDLGVVNADFVCSSIPEFCAAHLKEFDVAVSVDVVGYMDDEEFIRSHSAIKECLKPGGRYYLYIANGAYFLEWLKNRGLFPASAAPYFKVRVKSEYLALLREAGFSDLDVTFTPHYNLMRWLHPLSKLQKGGKVSALFQAKILVQGRSPR